MSKPTEITDANIVELLQQQAQTNISLRSQIDEYAANRILQLEATLKEARKWIGDGEYGDLLPREFWSDPYSDLIDNIDKAI